MATGKSASVTTLPKPGQIDPSNEAQVKEVAIALLESIPLVESSSMAFIAQVLNVEDVDDLVGEMQEKLPNAEAVVGIKMKVNGVMRNVSTVKDSPLPFYLIVDTTDTETGKHFLWQTSAGEPMMKLARIHAAGRFPVECETKGVQTNAGFTAYNLIVHRIAPAS